MGRTRSLNALHSLLGYSLVDGFGSILYGVDSRLANRRRGAEEAGLPEEGLAEHDGCVVCLFGILGATGFVVIRGFDAVFRV